MSRVVFKKQMVFPIVFMVSLFIFLSLSMTGKASESLTYGYSSVQIEEGDTIESIAADYLSDTDYTFTDMIFEIRRINHIATDTIYTGAYLVVPMLCSE